MKGLLTKIVTAEQEKAITQLYHAGTPKDQMLIRAAVASIAEDKPVIFESSGTDWILCTLCKAERPQHSTFRVFQAVAAILTRQWNFEGLTHLRETDKTVQCEMRERNKIADECLLGVAFFAEHLEQRSNRFGAPNTRFYAEVGKFAFSATGYEDVAQDWDFWTNFLSEELPIA